MTGIDTCDIVKTEVGIGNSKTRHQKQKSERQRKTLTTGERKCLIQQSYHHNQIDRAGS